jgi:hypothetical protein
MHYKAEAKAVYFVIKLFLCDGTFTCCMALKKMYAFLLASDNIIATQHTHTQININTFWSILYCHAFFIHTACHTYWCYYYYIAWSWCGWKSNNNQNIKSFLVLFFYSFFCVLFWCSHLKYYFQLYNGYNNIEIIKIKHQCIYAITCTVSILLRHYHLNIEITIALQYYITILLLLQY